MQAGHAKSERLFLVIVIACPGQGSQTPGFLNEWLEAPEAREFVGSVSESIGLDLITHGTTSDAETIRDTAIAQPLIVVSSLLAWQALSTRGDFSGAGVAGHSVGEVAAAAIAGVISFEDAANFVVARGKSMAAAAKLADTSMAAVVGGREEDVLAVIEEHGLTPANRNGAGQIVAAGAADGIARLLDNAPRGARVIQLQVAGAFHTQYMSPAVSSLRAVRDELNHADPTKPLWTNADGSLVTSGATYLDLLVSQVESPVRWDACMESFLEHDITRFIELTPAGALTGIAKRAMKGIPTVAIKSPADLDAAVALLSA